MTLDTIIKASGLKKNYLAEELGISKQAFNNKVKGIRQFKKAELRQLAETMEMPLRFIERTLPKHPKKKGKP